MQIPFPVKSGTLNFFVYEIMIIFKKRLFLKYVYLKILTDACSANCNTGYDDIIVYFKIYERYLNAAFPT